jgi:hypothetical protein
MKNLVIALVAALVLWGCTRNDTKYYSDGEDKGLAIFSDRGNNILSCFIAGKPWRTASRKSSGFIARLNYEVNIARQNGGIAKDTLVIQWVGYFENSANDLFERNISLHLTLPANSTFRDLSALQGKQIKIDSTNGFFTMNDENINPDYIKGTGNIYFHTARFDSSSNQRYDGNISGLFEADFINFKITRGRFDHYITDEQMRDF